MDEESAINNLIQYIKSNNCVIHESIHIPHKNKSICVEKIFFNNITEPTFRTFLDNQSDMIDVKFLCRFLKNIVNIDKMNKCDNTKGKWHEMIDIYHAMFGIEVPACAFPDYSKFPFLEPKREEYKYAWYIIRMLKQDELIGPFISIKCQVNIDGKFYDIQVGALLIEIQEDSNTHDNNQNDIIKKAIADHWMSHIVYFKIHEWRKRNYNYMNEFFNELRSLIIKSLLCANNEEFTGAYYVHMFLKYVDDKTNDLKKRLLSCTNKQQIKNTRNTIKHYESYKIKDTSMIIKILEWRKKSRNSHIYNIPAPEIIKYTCYKRYTLDEFEQFIRDHADYDYSVIDSIMFVNLKTFDKLIVLSSDDDDNMIDIKTSIIDYLHCVEDTSKLIIEMIIDFKDLIYNNLKYSKTQYINYITTRLDTDHEREIKKNHDENEILKTENKYLRKMMNATIKSGNKFMDSIIDAKIKFKGCKKKLETFKKNMDELKKYDEKINIDNIHFQKIINKPIITNIDDFPIIFTNNPDDNMKRLNFKGICSSFNIKDHAIRQLEKYIFNDVDSLTELIPFIKITDEYIVIKNDEINDEINEEHKKEQTAVQNDMQNNDGLDNIDDISL